MPDPWCHLMDIVFVTCRACNIESIKVIFMEVFCVPQAHLILTFAESSCTIMKYFENYEIIPLEIAEIS